MKQTLIFIVTYLIASYGICESTIDEPTWSFTDDFEGSVDNTFWAGAGVWVTYGADDPTKPGNKVMAMKYVPNSEGQGDSWTEYDFHLGIQAVQVEIRYDLYVPPNYQHIENNHKVFALWSGTYGKAKANISVSSEAWGKSGGATPSVYVGVDGNNYGHAMLSDSPLIWNDGEGRWIEIHIFFELAENPSDTGRLEISKNGSIITATHHRDLTKPYTGAPEGENLIQYSTKGNFIDQGTILGWANGAPEGGFKSDTVFLIDNFSIKARDTHGSVKATHGPIDPEITKFRKK
jgi:hypothetical protein